MRIIVNGVAYPQTAGATFTIKNLKLEKGTKPTKWTPAPEEEAAAQTQLIYISKASNTTSVTANTTWVTDANGGQNAWTTKRPVYNRDYPVLFVATQTRTIAQSQTGTACLCTTPVKDDTTTIIDGGHIITGTLTANQITTGVLKSFDETKTTYFDLTNSKLVAGNGGVVLDESGIQLLGSDEARIYSVVSYNNDPNSMRLTYWNLNFGSTIMDIDLSQIGLTVTEYDHSNPRTQDGELWIGGVPCFTTNYTANIYFQNLSYSAEGLEATIGFENSRNVALRGFINGDGVSSRFVTDTCATKTDKSEQIATDAFVWNAINYSSVVGRTRTQSGTANAADKSYKLYVQHFTLNKGVYSSSNAYSQLVMGDNHLDAAFDVASGTCNGSNVAVFFSMANDLSTSFVVGSKHGTLNGTSGWFATFSASIASGTALEINAIAIYFG